MVTKRNWIQRNLVWPLTDSSVSSWNWLFSHSPLIFTAIVGMGLLAFILWLLF